MSRPNKAIVFAGSSRVRTILIFNQVSMPTQPGHPYEVGKMRISESLE